MSNRKDALVSYLLSVTQSRRHFTDFLFKLILGIIVIIIVSPFFLILIQVAGIGFTEVFGSGPGQGIEFFTTFPGVGLEGGIRNALVGTVELIALASAVGIPVSVFGAVYITEYTQPGWGQAIVEFASDVLAGIPSIVFGAFGFAFLVDFLHIGMGIVAGSLTLAFMMIPTVLRTTQEALRAVPMSLREASSSTGSPNVSQRSITRVRCDQMVNNLECHTQSCIPWTHYRSLTCNR
jgi:phosphate transport system permease protein